MRGATSAPRSLGWLLLPALMVLALFLGSVAPWLYKTTRPLPHDAVQQVQHDEQHPCVAVIRTGHGEQERNLPGLLISLWPRCQGNVGDGLAWGRLQKVEQGSPQLGRILSR